MAYKDEIFKCRCCGEKKKNSECSAEDVSLCEDCNGDIATCVECGKSFICITDLQLCDKCIKKFDLKRLWQDHDNNKIDGLDFNENEALRNKYRRNKQCK